MASCSGRMRIHRFVVVALVLATSPASAQDPPPSTLDRVWRFAEWHRDEQNPYIQSVLFTGRFQHDLVALDARQGSLRESNIRRLRLGPRITLFRRWLLGGVWPRRYLPVRKPRPSGL